MKSIIVPPLNCFKVMPRGRDFDTPVTMAEASRRIFMPVLRDPSRHHGIGKVADTRQVFWEYFGGRRVFRVPRICGRQTFWFNGVVYSRELFGRHKYRCARFSLASSETGFIPPSLFYISRLDKRRYREIRFARCLVLSDAVENSILKVRSSIVRLQWNIFPDQSCFSKIRVSSFECFDDTSCDSKSDVMRRWTVWKIVEKVVRIALFESSSKTSKFTRHRR